MLAAVLAVFLQTQSAVNIDAVVTDKAGHRVAGLTRDDFELLEDGKRQTITDYTEAAQARPRRFVIFVDNSSLMGAARKQFFTTLRGFIDAQLRAGDHASLVSWSSAGLQIAAPLTGEKALLTAAIDRVEATALPASDSASYDRVRVLCLNDADLVRAGRMAAMSAYADCINAIRGETTVLINSSRALMNAISVTMTVTAGADGKKILIVAGSSLPQRPGVELFRWANVTYQQLMRGFDAARDTADPADDQRQKEMLEKLARSANAQGISIYPINAPMAGDVKNIMPGRDYGSDSMRVENTDAAFTMLAGMTGGLAARGPADFGAALASVAGDLEAYSSLGYRPRDDRSGDRAVVVRAKNPDYSVRARQSYAAKTIDDQMRDRVVANIYSASTKSDWPVTIRNGAPQRAGSDYTVPIEVTFPSTLTLQPEGGKLSGGFALYVAVGNKQGALSTVSRSVQPVQVPVAEEAEFRAAPVTVGVNLNLKPGENLVSIAVADQVSHAAGFARTTIVTP